MPEQNTRCSWLLYLTFTLAFDLLFLSTYNELLNLALVSTLLGFGVFQLASLSSVIIIKEVIMYSWGVKLPLAGIGHSIFDCIQSRYYAIRSMDDYAYMYTLEYFSGSGVECTNCDTDTVVEIAFSGSPELQPVPRLDVTFGTSIDVRQRTNAITSEGLALATNWTVATLLLVAFAIGMVGNLLVIFVIVILREYKKVITHWYVLQLALADIIFLLTIPFRIVEEIDVGVSLPQWACQARQTLFFLNYYASISFLVLMTIDRYIAICRRTSTKLTKLRKRWVIHFNTVVVWIASLIVCIPVMLYSTKIAPSCKCEFYASAPITVETSSGLSSSKCNYEDKSDTLIALLFFNAVAMFVMPLGIMAACYTMIALELKRKQSSYKTPNHDSDNRTPLDKSQRQITVATKRHNRNCNSVTTMSVCLVALFLLCWCPLHAFHMAKYRGIDHEDDYCEHLFNIAFTVAYLSACSYSIFNPCIYNFIGTKSESRLKIATSSLRNMIKSRSRPPCNSSIKQRVSVSSDEERGI